MFKPITGPSRPRIIHRGRHSRLRRFVLVFYRRPVVFNNLDQFQLLRGQHGCKRHKRRSASIHRR
jgi:hypothetical protein